MEKKTNKQSSIAFNFDSFASPGKKISQRARDILEGCSCLVSRATQPKISAHGKGTVHKSPAEANGTCPSAGRIRPGPWGELCLAHRQRSNAPSQNLVPGPAAGGAGGSCARSSSSPSREPVPPLPGGSR